MSTGTNRENCEVMIDTGRNGRTCLLVEGIADVNKVGRIHECRVVLSDISGIKRAEEGLLRYKILAHNSRDIVLFVMRDNGRILEANDAAIDAYGYNHEELLELTVKDLRSPESVAMADTQLAEADAHGILFETVHRRKDGSSFPVEVSSKGATINGTRTLVSVIRDITERRRAEDALRESELFYRQTLESIPGMVFTTRPDGYCDYQSQQWVEFTGVPMQEHLGDGWNRLLHPEDQPRAFAAWCAAVEDRAPYDLEYRVRRYDGAYEWFKVRGRPIRNAAGEIVRWFGTAVNIDHLLNAQETVRQQEERLRLALSAANMATWDWHVPSGDVVWNEMHYRMMGYDPGEVQPSYQAWAGRVHPDDIDAVQAEIQRCMAEGRAYTSEFRTLWPDGTIRWLEARGEFEYDENNLPLRNYGVMLDITERKQTEELIQRQVEELRTSNEDLALFNDAAVGRELRMIELKKEINEICAEAGLPQRYEMDCEEL
jgi:PAS domain S-box-containing protein